MSRLSLNAKLWSVLVVMWIGLLLLGGSTAWESREAMLDDRKAAIENIVEAATGVVSDLAAQANAHAITDDEAKKQALGRLQSMRYGTDGFVMVTDAHPTVLMHPTLPDLRNKDVSAFKGPNGTLVFVDMVQRLTLRATNLALSCTLPAGHHGAGKYVCSPHVEHDFP